MKITRDTKNIYLSKFDISTKILGRFETILCLHDKDEKPPNINMQKDDVLICGKYAYEHYQRMKVFNDYNRSGIAKELKPNIIKKIDLIATDQRKVYYDFLKLDLDFVYDFPISFITKNNFDWLNKSFLVADFEIRERSYLLTILGNTRLIIQKGYNEQYNKLVKLFIFKKDDNLLAYNQNIDNDNFENYLNYTWFEDTFHV